LVNGVEISAGELSPWYENASNTARAPKNSYDGEPNRTLINTWPDYCNRRMLVTLRGQTSGIHWSKTKAEVMRGIASLARNTNYVQTVSENKEVNPDQSFYFSFFYIML
jgi:hypothetical protein